MNSSPLTLATLRRVASVLLGAAVLFCTTHVAAQQQTPASWELRVCGDQDNLPYSSRDGTGFENRLAALLAEELGATVVFSWMPLPRHETDGGLQLAVGECDVITSVVDGQDPYLNTLNYYTQAAYFVTRTGYGAPTSLDDPLLTTATVGVNRGGPLDLALQSRVPLEHLVHFTARDAPSSIVDSVADGTIDVGIAWGPVAGYFTAVEGLALELTPVTPEFDMPFLSLTQPITLGVRPGDEALRDALNRALVARWAQVQALLDELHVERPVAPEPFVGATEEASNGELRVGLVLPLQVLEDPRLPDNAEAQAEAARRGALLAEEKPGMGNEVPVTLYLASAPNAAAAERAARRLAAVAGVAALAGGIGEGQAARLADVGSEFGLPVVNIADTDPALRTDTCESTVFNVAPGTSDYFGAMARVVQAASLRRLIVVYPDTQFGQTLLTDLNTSFDARLANGWLAGSASVGPQLPYYGPAFDEISMSGADGVVLLLDADAQLVFLGQYASSGLTAPVYALPTGGATLRQFYWTVARDAGSLTSTPRIAAWDAGVDDGTYASDYLARWGVLPDAVAWQAYTAVRVLQQAAAGALEAHGQLDGSALLASLRRPGVGYELDDDKTAEFGLVAHQLMLPLYELTLLPVGSEEYRTAQLMDVTGVVPAESVAGMECR